MTAFLPSLLCSLVVRGIYKSMASKLRINNPEQSIPKVVEPPYLYGVFIYDLALLTTISTFSSLAILDPTQELIRKTNMVIMTKN
jgi:hypothetical protein